MRRIIVEFDVHEDMLREQNTPENGEYCFADAVNTELGWLEQSGMVATRWEDAV